MARAHRAFLVNTPALRCPFSKLDSGSRASQSFERMLSLFKLIWCIVLFAALQIQAADSRLANTALLTNEGDLSAQMVAGIDRFLMREIEQSISDRTAFWRRDFSSPSAYERS